MREINTPTSSDGDPVELQALLYATGELEGAALTRFEKRLGEDQEAREALCHTMGITLALSGHPLATPHPAYRELVRQRLFPPQPVWQGWVRPAVKWTHPAVWTVAGTLVVLLALGLARPPRGKVPDADSNHGLSEAIGDVQRGAARDEGKSGPSPEAAIFWSGSNSEHLSRAREEESRRKGRAQDFQHPSRSRLDAEKSSARPAAIPVLK